MGSLRSREQFARLAAWRVKLLLDRELLLDRVLRLDRRECVLDDLGPL